MSRKMVRIWEGFSFKLTDEQRESIQEAFEEVEQANIAGDPNCALLAQVWDTEDGAYCCCHAVPSARATIIRQVLNTSDMLAIRVDEREAK